MRIISLLLIVHFMHLCIVTIIIFWPMVDIFNNSWGSLTITNRKNVGTIFSPCSKQSAKSRAVEWHWNVAPTVRHVRIESVSLILRVLKDILFPISFKRRRAEELLLLRYYYYCYFLTTQAFCVILLMDKKWLPDGHFEQNQPPKIMGCYHSSTA